MAVEAMPVEKMKERVGNELGVTEWFQMDQDRINKFADCTEDHQWIHVDEEKAAQGPFGQTIAHGYLTISLLPYFSADHALVPEGTMMAINYGINKLRFPNAVRVGSRLRLRATLLAVDEVAGGLQIAESGTFEVEGESRPACVAELLMRLYF